MDDLDAAIELAEARTGIRRPGAKLRACTGDDANLSHRAWSADEEDYLRANYRRMTEQAMGEHLHRSVSAVRLHLYRELHLTRPSKHPEILTAEQVAWGLGMSCGKSVHRLMDDGLMPHYILPGKDITRVVDRQVFLRWLLEPKHWIYFRPERVGTIRPHGQRSIGDCYDSVFWEEARVLVMKARAAWKDEWLTPGQASAAIGYKNRRTGPHCINTAIHRGTMPAARWGNWWIRRSDLPAADMTINVYGRIVPKVKPRYVCPRGMARHVHLSTCMKLRYCRALIANLKHQGSNHAD